MLTITDSEVEEIIFIENVDCIAGTDVMFGCGDDNPYR